MRAQVLKGIENAVRIECRGQGVALGTIVGSDGWILTKASQLGGEPQCVLSDGRKFAASLVGVDKQYDLAMLRIGAEDLPAVHWTSEPDLRPGGWLITPGVERMVASVGVISVGERRIEGTTPVLGVKLAPSDDESRIAEVYPRSGAAEAGIQEGDLITHIAREAVHNLNELRAALQKFHAGDVVQATIDRGNTKLELDVTLGVEDDIFSGFAQFGVNGPLSRRRDDFPKAFQHDSVLDPTLCGGPALDMAGRVVGINIARADRVATFALSSQVLPGLVEKFRSSSKSPSDQD